MAKKLVVQRNTRKSRGGGASYMKYLVFAAAGLVFLVIVTPYLLRDKNREAAMRPVPERGAITKQVPKEAEQPMPGKPAGPANAEKAAKTVEATPSGTATAPEAVKPPETQSSPKPTGAGITTPPQASTPETVSEGHAAVPGKVSPAPEVLFPKKNAPSRAPEAAALNRPAKPQAKAVGLTHRETTAPSSDKPVLSTRIKQGYAVQVGAIYGNRGQAETIRRELTAKGYEAVVRPAAGSGFFVTTRSCARSKAYTLMEQMSIQGLKNTKVVEAYQPLGHAE